MRQRVGSTYRQGFVFLVWWNAHLLPNALCKYPLGSQRHAGSWCCHLSILWPLQAAVHGEAKHSLRQAQQLTQENGCSGESAKHVSRFSSGSAPEDRLSRMQASTSSWLEALPSSREEASSSYAMGVGRGTALGSARPSDGTFLSTSSSALSGVSRPRRWQASACLSFCLFVGLCRASNDVKACGGCISLHLQQCAFWRLKSQALAGECMPQPQPHCGLLHST